MPENHKKALRLLLDGSTWKEVKGDISFPFILSTFLTSYTNKVPFKIKDSILTKCISSL